jgi:hypothetical protein
MCLVCTVQIGEMQCAPAGARTSLFDLKYNRTHDGYPVASPLKVRQVIFHQQQRAHYLLILGHTIPSECECDQEPNKVHQPCTSPTAKYRCPADTQADHIMIRSCRSTTTQAASTRLTAKQTGTLHAACPSTHPGSSAADCTPPAPPLPVAPFYLEAPCLQRNGSEAFPMLLFCTSRGVCVV